MKQIAYIIIFLLTCIGAVSCVETIVMDPGEKDLPVMVNCLLTPDSKVQTLYLQYGEFPLCRREQVEIGYKLPLRVGRIIA